VVLRRWERSKQKFAFVKRVDGGSAFVGSFDKSIFLFKLMVVVVGERAQITGELTYQIRANHPLA